MATALQRLRPILTPATTKHTASLIFLHGSGDTGDGVKSWLKIALGGNNLAFPHIRILYPTAPLRPYTPSAGMPSTVWFDRKQISPFCPEDMDSIDLMCSDIHSLVEVEVKHGIPKDRIIVGGFSMGGAMALYYALREGADLKGVFALSSFLNENSVVYESIRSRGGSNPQLFMCHGQMDPLVDHDWGTSTFEHLKSLGIQGEFHSYKNLFHELGKSEVKKLRDWIKDTLPEDG